MELLPLIEEHAMPSKYQKTKQIKNKILIRQPSLLSSLVFP